MNLCFKMEKKWIWILFFNVIKLGIEPVMLNTVMDLDCYGLCYCLGCVTWISRHGAYLELKCSFFF